MASNSAVKASGATLTTDSGRTYRRPEGEQTNSISFIRPSKLTDADIDSVLVEGMYAGAVPNDMTEKNDFKFVTDDGNTVILNGAGNLGYRLSKIALNSVVAVIYKGKNEIKDGPRKGKMAHSFDVLIAD